MIILGILGLALLLALVFGPQWWVRHTIRRHGRHRPDLPGTGGELARHLLDQAGLGDVRVEETTEGADHYDPMERAVRLSPSVMDARSISAVAIAAHEVSHALQHRDGDALLVTRTRWATTLGWVDRAAFFILMSIPVLGLILRSPLLVVVQIGAIVLLMGGRVLVHVLTVPLEIDASFKRALPLLQAGGYLPAGDMGAARSVLRAAAATYVASAMATLLDIIRWIR